MSASLADLADMVGQALVIRPGQTLLISVSREVGLDHLMEIKDALAGKLPGVEVLVINGIEQMAVYDPAPPVDPSFAKEQ